MPHPTCVVDGCDRPSKTKSPGMCGMHRERVRRYGDPHHVIRPQGSGAEGDRFWSRVNKDAPGGCWLWTGYSENGYGRFSLAGGNVKRAAHRVAYEWLVGPIPDGLEIDHLCRVRNCVNPKHLEPVTPRENTHRSPFTVNSIHAARTHCPQGHEYNEANTYLNAGKRYCRTCRRDRERHAWTEGRRSRWTQRSA